MKLKQSRRKGEKYKNFLNFQKLRFCDFELSCEEKGESPFSWEQQQVEEYTNTDQYYTDHGDLFLCNVSSIHAD